MRTEIVDYFLLYDKIVKAEVCPYCGRTPEFLISSELVYGKDYGSIYICRPCSAWVGCHKNSEAPLGRLADDQLRNMKIRAHAYFDGLWKAKEALGYSNARSLGYKWLAKVMNKREEYCHIGMFTVKECQQVVDICAPYYNN